MKACRTCYYFTAISIVPFAQVRPHVKSRVIDIWGDIKFRPMLPFGSISIALGPEPPLISSHDFMVQSVSIYGNQIIMSGWAGAGACCTVAKILDVRVPKNLVLVLCNDSDGTIVRDVKSGTFRSSRSALKQLFFRRCIISYHHISSSNHGQRSVLWGATTVPTIQWDGPDDCFLLRVVVVVPHDKIPIFGCQPKLISTIGGTNDFSNGQFRTCRQKILTHSAAITTMHTTTDRRQWRWRCRRRSGKAASSSSSSNARRHHTGKDVKVRASHDENEN
mmetsp:Transcript_2594/g.4703  ORF Transcript_2594/g.4703 Transcript_2594/m.4703 type:complete len:277 (-) Transcript_2594:321-1151(-)